MERKKKASLLRTTVYKDPFLLFLRTRGKLSRSCRIYPISSVLPPSVTVIIIGLYIALNRTPNIDCYWVGAVPNLSGASLKPFQHHTGPNWTRLNVGGTFLHVLRSPGRPPFMGPRVRVEGSGSI